MISQALNSPLAPSSPNPCPSAAGPSRLPSSAAVEQVNGASGYSSFDTRTDDIPTAARRPLYQHRPFLPAPPFQRLATRNDEYRALLSGVGVAVACSLANGFQPGGQTYYAGISGIGIGLALAMASLPTENLRMLETGKFILNAAVIVVLIGYSTNR